MPAEDDRVLELRPAELPALNPPLTVTCGEKQVRTSLEPTTFDRLAGLSYLFIWCWQPRKNNVPT